MTRKRFLRKDGNVQGDASGTQNVEQILYLRRVDGNAGHSYPSGLLYRGLAHIAVGLVGCAPVQFRIHPASRPGRRYLRAGDGDLAGKDLTTTQIRSGRDRL